MPRATWNGAVLADAADADVERVEGNVYFAPGDVAARYLRASDHRTVCSWKGTAHYYDVVVDGQENANAAWYYPQPMDAAQHVTGRIAFWKGVRVE